MGMMIPTALSKSAFNASNAEIFYFTSSGGNQVVKNKLTINNNSTGLQVYTATVTIFDFQQTLPAGTLTNGVYYNYYFNTYDVSNNMSANSNSVPFYCYASPVITLTNIPSTNIIQASSYTFNCTYTQASGEKLNYLVYYLYDSVGNELSNSGALYSALTPPLSFTYTFNGFTDATSYKIKVMGVSVNGTVTYSSTTTFTTEFYSPTLYSVVRAENQCDLGCMRITNNLAVINGMMSTGANTETYYSKITDGNDSDYIMWDTWYTVGDDEIISVWAESYALDLSTAGNQTSVFPQSGENNYIKWDEWYNVGDDEVISLWLESLYNMGTSVLFNQGFGVLSDYQFQLWGLPRRDGIVGYMYKTGNETDRLVITLKSGIPTGETTVKNWFEISTEDGSLFLYSNYVSVMLQDTEFIIWFKKIGTTYTLLLDIMTVGTGTAISWDGGFVYPTSNTIVDANLLYPMDTIILGNMIVDNFEITSNTNRAYSQSYPVYDYSTVINCTFNGTLNGGNTNLLLSQLSGIKLKRRLNNTFDWVALKYLSVTGASSLSFVYDDYLCPTGRTFDWAIVPILRDGTEGSYIMVTNATSFDGCYIIDNSGAYKFYNACTYPTAPVNSLTAGVFSPLGSKFPITIYNTENDYDSGAFSGDLFGYNFMNTRVVDRIDAYDQQFAFTKALKNKSMKMFKDWNGKIMIIVVTSALTTTPDLISGKYNISFQWVQVGEYDNQDNLFQSNLVNTSS